MNTVLKKSICTAVILAVICLGIYVLGYFLRPANTDTSVAAIKSFHEMPENSFEVIGYGSSHMWKGMNPAVLYTNYGITAYNYGSNWQRINTTLLFLKDSLRTQHPKVALIETYRVDAILENSDINGEIYYTREIGNFDGKEQYLRQVFGDDKERYLSYYVPLCAFHDNWTDISKNSFRTDISNAYPFSRTMGFYGNDVIHPVEIPEQGIVEQKELNAASLEILDEITELCRKENIGVVFYTAPWAGEYEYSGAMKSYAAARGCVYLNLFEYQEETGIDGNTDFYDEGHLNISGSNKVSLFLGQYLSENYNLTDFRPIEDNVWNEYHK